MSFERIPALTVAICLSLLSSTRPLSTFGPVLNMLPLLASEIGRRIVPGTKVLLGKRSARVNPVVPGSAPAPVPPDAEDLSPHAANVNSAPALARRWRRDIDIVPSV